MTESKKCYASLAIAGAVAAAVFLLAWILAASVDTSWVLGQNTLSDLGVSSTDAKYFFNYGCMICGALVAVFGLGFILGKESNEYVISGILAIIAGIALIGVGCITKDFGNGNLHVFIAYFLGMIMIFSIIAMTAGDWKKGKAIYGGIGLLVLIVSIASAVTLAFAAWEAVVVVLICVWITSQTLKVALD